jgi:phage tail sheath protein FI
MPFQLSPGVAVVEKDFSAIVPAVSTSRGAFAGAFQWGPVMSPTQVTSENELVQLFGKPVDANFKSFFTAANFLSYTNALLMVRADATGARNAVATLSGTVTSVTLGAAGSGYTSVPTATFSAPDVSGGLTATGTVTISGGAVTAATVSAGGTSYTTPTITFSAPQLAGGVTATGTLTVSSGVITAVVIVTAGSGYTSAPTATIGNVGSGTGATIGSVTIAASTVTGLTITNAGTGYTSAPTVTITGGAGTGATFTAAITTGGVKINNSTDYINNFANGAGTVGEFAAKYPGALGNSLLVSICDSVGFSTWAYKDNFGTAPSTSTYTTNIGGTNDELHVVVVDENGLWTGVPGTVLEKFPYCSKASDAKTSNGSSSYYKNVLNASSSYVYWMDHPTTGTNWGTTAAAKTFVNLSAPITRSLSGGVDDLAVSDGNLMTAWALFADDASYDISLIPLGGATTTVANYVIGNVCETRLDCVAFVSPQNTITGEVIVGAGSAATDQIIAYRNALPSTSYAVMDSGYKYQYDRYNDVYRFVPLNGDVAGLCARTDNTNDPWFSPGGLNRGQIKNVVKLGTNPTKADRDLLYSAGVNPVVTFPGEGTVLFGDKTLLAKPSAFDRINVRRLFIVMEKAIATAAKFQLFEFNDSFTQAQFRNLVEPFLRNVQGRRGITDFRVVCDSTNNTGEVIDSNNFVADIYVKPNRSINFITLNFIAARSAISFNEIGA